MRQKPNLFAEYAKYTADLGKNYSLLYQMKAQGASKDAIKEQKNKIKANKSRLKNTIARNKNG